MYLILYFLIGPNQWQGHLGALVLSFVTNVLYTDFVCFPESHYDGVVANNKCFGLC